MNPLARRLAQLSFLATSLVKKPFVLIESHTWTSGGPRNVRYQVQGESLGRRYRQEGPHVVEEAYNYVGWHKHRQIDHARILERFRWGKDAQKALRDLIAVRKVMQS